MSKQDFLCEFKFKAWVISLSVPDLRRRRCSMDGSEKTLLESTKLDESIAG
ncbi:hypothetical protein H5410_029176 [Solanum commersonii]|uniref:Uncharacterized protein n=1 Tax=Solanum commersonii TaxID=4109 RepID=A0A9J5Z892_SOLCO|nr:hypothetical protein H5410_029176 [Solanum commersonii]